MDRPPARPGMGPVVSLPIQTRGGGDGGLCGASYSWPCRQRWGAIGQRGEQWRDGKPLVVPKRSDASDPPSHYSPDLTALDQRLALFWTREPPKKGALCQHPGWSHTTRDMLCHVQLQVVQLTVAVACTVRRLRLGNHHRVVELVH